MFDVIYVLLHRCKKGNGWFVTFIEFGRKKQVGLGLAFLCEALSEL